MTRTEGTIGDEGTDAHIHWTTVDDGNSYLPAIHCGSFELVIGRGSHWTGAANESAGVVFVAPYNMYDADDQPLENLAEVKFPWCEDQFLVAVADALGQLEKVDIEHPAPHNVLEAAKELWVALRLEGREAF